MRKLKKNGFTPLETIQGPTPQKKRRFLTGFTLVEILASVLLMTVVIVPFITFAANNFTVGMDIERKTRSNLLAEVEMEKIKNTLSKSFETEFFAWPSDLGDNYRIFRLVWDVSDTLKIIQVHVGYDNDKNGLMSMEDEVMVTFTTQYAKRS